MAEKLEPKEIVEWQKLAYSEIPDGQFKIPQCGRSKFPILSNRTGEMDPFIPPVIKY